MNKIIKNNLFMLRYIFKYVPGLIVYTVLLKIYTGFIRVFTGVYVAKYILDSIQLKRSIVEVTFFLIFLVTANVISAVASAFYEEIFYPKRKEILFRKMHGELFEKAKSMELACYDNPEFYNDFIWSINQADGKALEVLDTLGKFLNRFTQMVGTGGILLSIDGNSIVAVAAIGLFTYGLNIAINKKQYALSKEENPLRRKRDYTSRVLYLADYAKEIRLSRVKEKLVQNFKDTNKNLVETIRSYGKKLFGLWMTGNVIYMLIFYGYLLYVIYMILVRHAFTYGDFVGLYSGTDQLNSVSYSLGNVLTEFQKHSLYIEKFRVFLNYQVKMQEGTRPMPKPGEKCRLEVKHVTFRYEGADEPTLYDVNLVMEPGERLALVGYNGAGKSTLIKLLMRLYDPTEGCITLNGVDIREYSSEECHKYFSVVFQDYKLFAATIAENVMMQPVTKEDFETVYSALEKSDFKEKLDSLEDGVETLLTREFSKKGVNLSGGEAQKVAIARIFPGNSSMVILDEPSSALDPVTEYNVNQSMLKAAGDKNIVYISHRLSTTKMADRIIMLEKGRIIEEGSHEELMEFGGKYAEMFTMQAEKYREEQAG